MMLDYFPGYPRACICIHVYIRRYFNDNGATHTFCRSPRWRPTRFASVRISASRSSVIIKGMHFRIYISRGLGLRSFSKLYEHNQLTLVSNENELYNKNLKNSQTSYRLTCKRLCLYGWARVSGSTES